jgi:hypothetical protein
LQKEFAAMSATVHVLGRPAGSRPVPLRAPRQFVARPGPPDHAWLVDVGVLAQVRALVSGHELPAMAGPGLHAQALLDVPSAYEQFCRSHFASVKRLHPQLEWNDACLAYAVALSAHAVLCDELGEETERRLGEAWPKLRGESTLEWPQARGLVADGCSALARLDPLAMRR